VAQQRDTIKTISPPWLATGTAEKFMYTFGLMSDLVLEKMNQAMLARMPTLATPSALPFIGLDRVIVQGPEEPDSAYAIRLQKAFDAWQHAGERRAILEELTPFYLQTYETLPPVTPGQYPLALIVNSSGAPVQDGPQLASWDWYYNTQDTSTQVPVHMATGYPYVWNWDWTQYPNNLLQWWRTWIVFFFVQVPQNVMGGFGTLSNLVDGFVTLSGLTNINPNMVGMYVTISGAASSANNGTFQITATAGINQITLANPQAVTTDAHNGALSWTIVQYPTIAPAPVFGAPGCVIGPSATSAMTGQWVGKNISVGLAIPPGIITGMRNILWTWKSATTFYVNIIFSFGGSDGRAGSDFSPLSSEGAGNPNGYWNTWAVNKNGIMQASRVTGTALGKFNAFADGTAIYQQCYVPTGT
jgi:hypothetical protein